MVRVVIYRAMIIVFKHFFYKNYVGLSLWPFIFIKTDSLKEDVTLINHERIHLQQQKELLIVPFYIWYVAEWIIRSLYYFDSYKAYKNISFEREAYYHENEHDYIERRKTFAFIKYL